MDLIDILIESILSIDFFGGYSVFDVLNML